MFLYLMMFTMIFYLVMFIMSLYLVIFTVMLYLVMFLLSMVKKPRAEIGTVLYISRIYLSRSIWKNVEAMS
jgi:hypothetical protein